MGRARGKLKPLFIAAIAAALTAMALGCGSSSSSSSSASSSTQVDSPSTTTARAGKKKPADLPAKSDKSKPKNKKKTQFYASDGQQVKKFGSPAPTAEREAASAVLASNLHAREAGEWAVQCASMTVATQKEVAKFAKAKPSAACAESLESIAKPLKKTMDLREDTLAGKPIAELRVKGVTGYAIYQGSDEVEYAVPLKEEAGKWRVDSLTPTAIG